VAIDGAGAIWLLQSRPVTAVGHVGGQAVSAAPGGAALLRGLGAAPGVVSGPARILASLADGDSLSPGDVLVAHMTAPDWVPLMRRAAAVVTDSGGMTCHAAIVSRELGMPCVVGTSSATTHLHDDEAITVDTAEGVIREGAERAPEPVSAPAASRAAGRPPRQRRGCS
jgi:pyruvate,water dikinase